MSRKMGNIKLLVVIFAVIVVLITGVLVYLHFSNVDNDSDNPNNPNTENPSNNDVDNGDNNTGNDDNTDHDDDDNDDNDIGNDDDDNNNNIGDNDDDSLFDPNNPIHNNIVNSGILYDSKLVEELAEKGLIRIDESGFDIDGEDMKITNIGLSISGNTVTVKGKVSNFEGVRFDVTTTLYNKNGKEISEDIYESTGTVDQLKKITSFSSQHNASSKTFKIDEVLFYKVVVAIYES